MKYFIVVACLILTGCFHQTINQWDIERAVIECGNLESIVEITASFDGSESVTCKSDKKSKVF